MEIIYQTARLWATTVKAAHIARAHTEETFVAFIDRIVKQEAEKVRLAAD